jgi:phospholipid/cholesterol/gamma-HCH transport system substrate-binding protein
MFRDEKIEMKVGFFMGVGIFLMFLIVFSVGDFYFLREGYEVEAVFDFVNGIKKSAPIRLAGVNVGEVNDIKIFYDEELARTRVSLNLKIGQNVFVEKDAVVRINTLGLLGEQYAEITPGQSKEFLSDGDVIEGRNPVNVGLQMEMVKDFVEMAASMARDARDGKGTIGKLITDDRLYENLADFMEKISSPEGTVGRLLSEDTIYRDLEAIFGKIARGEGTIGRLLTEDDIYDNLEYFTRDIKNNPWKLLRVTSEKKTEETKKTKTRGTLISPR